MKKLTLEAWKGAPDCPVHGVGGGWGEGLGNQGS